MELDLNIAAARTAKRAASMAALACRLTGGTKRTAFLAALEAWQAYCPEDDLIAHEHVVPLVLALEERLARCRVQVVREPEGAALFPEGD